MCAVWFLDYNVAWIKEVFYTHTQINQMERVTKIDLWIIGSAVRTLNDVLFSSPARFKPAAKDDDT